ncbi:hypothetical protein NST41_33980 [Paenibacillus sp. FSL L8-0696]|uniref:type II toxin-antitoxin system PemK/MazF family toxin n=1 Tax=unclassified Paenibacillus TaxID=185978 RepID=UPI0030F5F2B9
MSYIDRNLYEDICETNRQASDEENIQINADKEKVFEELDRLVGSADLKYKSTWLLEKDLWLQAEDKQSTFDTEVLSRGRVVLVNPGVDNIGREQRLIHPYIVLGEYKDMFIGVPITNQGYDPQRKKNFIRHFFEVPLVNPQTPKPFNEYRCSKPTVADLRNISGLDKRRIIRDELYNDKKFAPATYLQAISQKIRTSIALI